MDLKYSNQDSNHFPSCGALDLLMSSATGCAGVDGGGLVPPAWAFRTWWLDGREDDLNDMGCSRRWPWTRPSRLRWWTRGALSRATCCAGAASLIPPLCGGFRCPASPDAEARRLLTHASPCSPACVWLRQITCTKALKEWESREGIPLAEAKVVRMYGGIATEGKRQFITKLDNGLNSLKECE